jgi:F-type H+-transporting ATPase subunit delta
MAVAHRTYARALFEAAKEEGRLERVQEELGDFAASVGEVEQLRSVLESPELESRTKAGLIDDVLGKADPLVRNFVRLLVEKGRAAELAEIAREFEALVAREQGILDVELTTAVELSQKDFDQLVERVGKASGRKVRASRAVDPSLVGGLVLQVGSRRMDASIRGRLDRLQQELTTRRSAL